MNLQGPPPQAENIEELSTESDLEVPDLPPNYYLTSLQDFVPKTITIAFEESYPNLKEISFC